jgi:hypothetical protein
MWVVGRFTGGSSFLGWTLFSGICWVLAVIFFVPRCPVERAVPFSISAYDAGSGGLGLSVVKWFGMFDLPFVNALRMGGDAGD